MTTSGYEKVKVYFDAPCREFFASAAGDTPTEDNHPPTETHVALRQPGETSGPMYKIHMINLDRQKDDSIHVVITDFTGVQQ